MKKIFAVATVAALMAGGSAFAADSSVRLDDTQMDQVSAGGFSLSNLAIIAPITTVQNNQSAIAVGVVAKDVYAANTSYTSVKNNIWVSQKRF